MKRARPYDHHTLVGERPVYLIGIGGAGMSVIAELLHERGFTVAGSDRAESHVLAALRERGITAYGGHRAEQLPADAQVVISTAIPDTNPELAAAYERGLPVLHRSQALAQAASGQQLITVAGAHGKTTTSAMLAWALAALGADPSYAVGADLPGMGPGAHLGAGQYFVAEADESDGSFLNYRPQISLILNVEADHLDHYGDQRAFVAAFQDFAQLTGKDGTLIVCADDVGARALGAFACERAIPTLSYGSAADADFRLTRTAGHAYIHRPARLGQSASADGLSTSPAPLAAPEGSALLDLAIPGEHNELNATGAFAVLSVLGFTPEKIIPALNSFPGAARRAQVKAVIDLAPAADSEDGRQLRQVRVIDDYAHHPTEVAATIRALRHVCPGKLRVIFQPHLYSRTATFAEQFARALVGADDVVVTSVYPAREDPIPGVDGHLIAEAAQADHVQFNDSPRAGAIALASRAEPGDLLITMGAGDITAMAPVITSELISRGGQARELPQPGHGHEEGYAPAR